MNAKRLALQMAAADLLCAGAALAHAHAGDAETGSAASLRAKHAALRSTLGNNPFQRRLHLESSESPEGVTGDIHALIENPFAMVTGALSSPGDWSIRLAQLPQFEGVKCGRSST